MSAQPIVLPPFGSAACILLPTPDILLWSPTNPVHVPLPQAVRPVSFLLQGVVLAPNGLFPLDARRIDAS